MADKLDEAKLAEMFSKYCERQSVQYVARACSVSRTTVRKYKRVRKWDEKRAKAVQKAEAKVVDRLADRNAKLLQIAEHSIQAYAAGIAGKVQVQCPHCGMQHPVTVPKVKLSAFDFKCLVQLIKEELEPEGAGERNVLEIILREPGDGVGDPTSRS